MTIHAAVVAFGLAVAAAPPPSPTESEWKRALRATSVEDVRERISALEAARTGTGLLLELLRCGPAAPDCDHVAPTEIRAAAAMALGRVEPLGALMPGATGSSLLDTLVAAARETGVDTAAVFALGQLGSAALASGQPALATRVEARLLGLLTPADPEVPSRPVPPLTLWRALGRVGGEATLARALGTVSDLERPVALVTAGLVLTRLARDPASEPRLVEAVDAHDPEVRAAALYAFARAGKAPLPAAVVARILSALEGGPSAERVVAARAFRKAGLAGGFEAEAARIQALLASDHLEPHEAAVVMAGFGAAAPAFRANVIRHVAFAPADRPSRLVSPWFHVALAAAHDLPEGAAIGADLAALAPPLARRTADPAFDDPVARRLSLLVCALAEDDALLDLHCTPAGRVERAAALGRPTASWLASPAPGARMAALTASTDAAAIQARLSDPDGPVVATACTRAAELDGAPPALAGAVVARATALATEASSSADAVEPALDCFKAAKTLSKGVPEALAVAALRSAPALRRLASDGAALPPQDAPLPPLPSGALPPAPTAFTVLTDVGRFTIALDAENAPMTVRHLAKLAAARRFGGLTVHRVVPDFVIQTGDPRGDGWGGLSAAIPCENNDLPYLSGSVGMALAGKDTGTSQWFVTHTPHPHLHGTYTQFGRVVAGLDTVDRLVPGDRVLSVTVER